MGNAQLSDIGPGTMVGRAYICRSYGRCRRRNLEKISHFLRGEHVAGNRCLFYFRNHDKSLNVSFPFPSQQNSTIKVSKTIIYGQ